MHACVCMYIQCAFPMTSVFKLSLSTDNFKCKLHLANDTEGKECIIIICII